MLFNAEMIDNFLSDFERSSLISEKDWRISHARLSTGEDHGDLSILYVSETKKGTVICRNGENRFEIHNVGISEVFNRIADQMSYYNQWEMHALNSVQSGADSLESISMLRDLFPDYLVKIVTLRGKVLYSSQENPETYIDSSFINTIRNIPACYHISLGVQGLTVFWDREHYKKNIMFGNVVFHNGSYIMFSVIELEKPITATEQHLARRAQEIFERLEFMSEMKSLIEPHERTMASLLNSETVSDSAIKNLEAIWNYRISSGACLALIRNPSLEKFGNKAVVSAINDRISSAFAFAYDKQVFCLLPFEHLYRNCGILEKMTEAYGAEIVFSTSINSWTDIAWMYRHMQYVSKTLKEHGRYNRIIYCADYIRDYYLWLLEEREFGPLVHPDIVRLRNLDSSEKLLETFYCFLANNCKMSLTADQLHIHLSTLKYRMEKINSTVALDPENYEGRMAFLLSYDLLKMKENKTSEKATALK